MNILITGAKGFVGKNLTYALKNIKDGKDKTHPNLLIENIFEYDIDTDKNLLEEYCKNADFVFNLAGVNRPKDNSEFMQGNFGFASDLLNLLKKYSNTCPIMLSSSIQASLEGRFKDSEYGKSKLAGEELFFAYGKETNSEVYVYRFTNLFGKWCKPNYNSAVATFCHNVANDLPITVSDRNIQINLLYVDDLVSQMISLLEGKVNRCDYVGEEVVENNKGKYCYCKEVHKVSLGEIVDLLYKFNEFNSTIEMQEIEENSFAKKLYSTYLSYLPERKACVDLKMNIDDRGSFTELLKTKSFGQFSVNVSNPEITKGEHWHNSKWELFIVVSGNALIRQRKVDSDEVIEFNVSGEKIQAVYMLPGYTHSIINLSKTEKLVTLMWANEKFDKNHPDTFFEKV